MEFLKELGAFGTGILLAIGVGGLFWKADEGLSKEGRADLSLWLRRQFNRHGTQLDRDPPNLPSVVSAMFTKVLGNRHLSWRCFLMSCLFSILAVGLLTFVYSQIDVLQWKKFLSSANWLLVGFAFLGLNLFPDYISLMETRVVIRLMGRTRRVRTLIGYLGLDSLLTLLIFCGVGGVLFGTLLAFRELLTLPEDLIVLSTTGGLINEIYTEVMAAVLNLRTLTFSGSDGALGIFLYSTFFTSVWVWLTALGWGVTRLLAKSPPLIRLMNRALPIDTHPMRAIGEVAAVIVCLGYWIVAVVTWIATTGEAQTAVAG